MRTLVSGGVEVHDMDSIMELDLEILHCKQASLPVNALSTMADSLPGLRNCRRCAGRGDHDERAGQGAARRDQVTRSRPLW